MATPNQRLATSLRALQQRQEDGRRVFRTHELSRVHRERLIKNGFLRPIIKGWLLSTGPDVSPGDTTPWYASFWEFCGRYCRARFGADWHLSPEQSLLLHAENTVIPSQVIVYAGKGSNNNLSLPFGTSLYDLKHQQPLGDTELSPREGLQLYAVAAALVKVTDDFFRRHPVEAQIALRAVRDASEILRYLLTGGHSGVAGRLVGAFRRVERPLIADEILAAMATVGYDVRARDPFSARHALVELPPDSPAIVGRLTALWQQLRGPVVGLFQDAFHDAPGRPTDKPAYMATVDAGYDSDAYHSLSIEGYRVTSALIDRVRVGGWRPDLDSSDRVSRDALAARGYWLAFQLVRDDLERLVSGARPGELFKRRHRDWYRALFSPAVTAGIIAPHALAGYRRHPVYITGSRHLPPSWTVVPDAMNALGALLEAEPEASVRAVLGHWMLGYIHPFPDGNGRIARFTMNAMLASGGYPWAVIRVGDRARYMAALESASVDLEIRPIAKLILEGVRSAERG